MVFGLKEQLADLKDRLLDSYYEHRMKYWIGIGSITILLVGFVGISTLLSGQERSKVEAQYQNVAQSIQTMYTEVESQFVENSDIYIKDAATADVVNALEEKVESLSKDVNNWTKSKTVMNYSTISKDITDKMTVLKAKFESLKNRVTSRDAVFSLYDKQPMENDKVYAIPSVKSNLEVDVIENVTKLLGRPADDYFIILNNLKDLAWNETQTIVDLDEALKTLQETNSQRLADWLQLILRLEQITNATIKEKYYASVSPVIVKILNAAFGSYLKYGDDGELMKQPRIKIDDESANVMSLLIHRLRDPNLVAHYEGYYRIAVDEMQQQRVKEFETTYQSRLTGFREDAERTADFDFRLPELMPSGDFIGYIVSGADIEMLEKPEVTTTESVGQEAGARPPQAVLAEWNSYSFFTRADGAIVYTKPTNPNEVLEFNAAEVVLQYNGVSYYYHPVSKVLYSVDALGNAQVLDVSQLPVNNTNQSNAANNTTGNTQDNPNALPQTNNPNPNAVVR